MPRPSPYRKKPPKAPTSDLGHRTVAIEPTHLSLVMRTCTLQYAHVPKVTLTQVARLAGVTHQTASRALGAKAHLHAPDTVARVLAAARELGYRPNASAQALRSGDTATIALLLDTESARSAMPADLLHGICAALAERHWHLAVDRPGEQALAGAGFVPRLLEQVLARGALVNIHGPTAAPIAERLAADAVPAIWLNYPGPHNAVRFDDHHAVAHLVQALQHQGRLRLLYCDESHPGTGGHASKRDRLAAFTAAAGPQSRTWLTPGGQKTQALAASLTAAIIDFSADKPVDGFVCYGMREVALLVHHVLPALGRRAGHDCQIATIGTWSEVRHQPVLAMIQPWDVLGRTAVELLEKRMNDYADQPSRLIPCLFDPTPGESDS